MATPSCPVTKGGGILLKGPELESWASQNTKGPNVTHRSAQETIKRVGYKLRGHMSKDNKTHIFSMHRPELACAPASAHSHWLSSA